MKQGKMGGTSGCHSLIPSSPADDVDERQQPTIDEFPFRHEGRNAKERRVCKERGCEDPVALHPRCRPLEHLFRNRTAGDSSTRVLEGMTLFLPIFSAFVREKVDCNKMQANGRQTREQL